MTALYRPCVVCGVAVDSTRSDTRCPRHRRSTRDYRGDWRRRRDEYLALHPWCVFCLEAGRQTKARNVDHIRALKDGGTNEDSNLRSLCWSCHSRRTAVDQSGWRDESR